MIEMTNGDMFAQPADIRVNTVNCVGVMGAGVALAFKKRYPTMYEEYRLACKRGEVRPGRIMEWRELGGDWVLNFPTKRDWRDPSRYEDIEAGLDAFRAYLQPLGSVTVALPALGCGHGGLDWKRVSAMIQERLADLDANIRVYAPEDSRAAGRKPGHDVLESDVREAQQLGFSRVSLDGLDVFSSNSKDSLDTTDWMALFPSRDPSDREMTALRAVASAVADQAPATVIALVHQGKASEKIAVDFSKSGLNVLLIAPIGILTRKTLTRLPSDKLGVVTLGAPHEKWSRGLFSKAINLLRGRSSAILLSDPEPVWIINKPDSWKSKSISFVDYEQMLNNVRLGMKNLGARPVRRRASDGQPNVAALLNTASQSVDTNHKNSLAGISDAVTLSFDFTAFKDEERKAALALLSSVSPQHWLMELTFTDAALAAAVEDRLDRLRHLPKN